jgi:hypothetical protein
MPATYKYSNMCFLFLSNKYSIVFLFLEKIALNFET